MSISNPNYRETYFLKPDLSPIIGKPTFESLYQLIVDLQANAQSVHSNLGGGANGHLGLIMTPTQYAIHSTTPYVRPTHPGTLTIPGGTTRLVAEEMERNHAESLRVFHEVRGVEQALIQQLVTAIDNKYLIAFKNRATGQFNGTLVDVIQHLRTTYGKISPAQLITYETEVTTMTYDPTTPIDLVFSKIDDLLMYGEFANCPFTATQAITKGYHILNNCGNVYNDYLRSWNRIQANQKTWNHFKTHFRQAYNELEATNALNIGDLGYGTANVMKEVVDRISEELLLRANHASDSVPVTNHMYDSVPATSHAYDSVPAANHTSDSVPTQADLIQKLLAQNNELIRCITEKTQVNVSRRNKPQPKQGQPTKPLPPRHNKYCWTHGRCNHQGSECRNKAPGHKVEASMSDKMGGSTYACPPN